MKELKSWFSKRGYPDGIISEQVYRALRSEEIIKERDGKPMEENGVPLVVTYNLNFKNLRILIRKNFVCRPRKPREFLRQHLSSPSEVLGT